MNFHTHLLKQRFQIWFIALGSFTLQFGCPVLQPIDGNDAIDGTVGVDPKDHPGTKVQGEPNDGFSLALMAILDASGNAELTGSIETEQDVDIFDLGPVQPGDRLRVDIKGESKDLDMAFAVFDEQERILFENDDRDFDTNDLDPFINATILRETSHTYLAIASSPLGLSDGDYHAIISLERGGTVPETQTQIVVLDFSGGSINIPGDRTYTVDAFNAADIASAYAGTTETIIDGILATVEENYEGLAIEFRVLPGDTLPSGEFSRVYFGGDSQTAFGVAQDVDTLNRDRCDDAIIFVETFTPDNFGRVLSVAQMGVAIGNVATHEIGHLLGLNHVAAPTDIMDTTGTPSTFAVDQEFQLSPLSETIFPVGFQDGLLLLMEILGAG